MTDFRARIRAARYLALFTAFGSALALGDRPVAAQVAGGVAVRDEVFVNSEVERYLRILQATGQVEAYPWMLRSFSPHEVERLLPSDSAHPWARRYDLEPVGGSGLRFGLVRPGVATVYNSAFPFGANLGAVWAGKGLTTIGRAGAAVRYGPLSLTVAPVAFRSENDRFALAANGFHDERRFRDPERPGRIDLPQRFGDEAYARIDLGQSTLRLDAGGVALGVSTANQHWGPARDQPILLGSNAPGFLHGFLGTSRPADLWVGRLHARAVWGQLEQSAYSPMSGHGSRRLMSGVVAIFTPRGLPHLDLGGARFFHEAWPREGLRLRDLGKPFEVFLKEGLASVGDGDFGNDPDNQLVAVFIRWVLPRSGFEVYAEYGRNDHSWDLRDFFLEPDQNGGHLFGFQKAWAVRGTDLLVARGELLNTAQNHVKQVREQVPFYIHHAQRQGHTHRGQILGAATGYGGGGSVLAADYYHRGGRVSLAWRRELRNERGQYWWDQIPPEPGLDVIYGLGVDALVFYGRWDIGFGLHALRNLNRGYESDRSNLNLTLGVSAPL